MNNATRTDLHAGATRFGERSFFVTLIAMGLSVFAGSSNLTYAGRKHIAVSASRGWTSAGIQVREKDAVTVWSRGEYRIDGRDDASKHRTVSPRGTFRFADSDIGMAFPLAAAGAGPAPCFCLIGRIGQNGEPFYLGEKCSFVAQDSGELFLGINDFDLADNEGEVEVVIETDATVIPASQRTRVGFDGPSGEPVAGARVVVFYIDGLRPDVVEEMAAMGHLPVIRKWFLEGGSRLENAFTVFPSDTITSNGSLWTGKFSDQHGIKSQVGFNRRLRQSENYLGKFGPVLNDLLLMPKGLDRILLKSGQEITRLTKGNRSAEDFHNRRTSETWTLQARLVDNQKSFGSGVMPLMSQVSPELWTRYLADEVPYFGTHLADRYVDEANTTYAIENLFETPSDVTIVWLPENDTVSHHEFRGAFGMARRALVEADDAIGQMIGRLDEKGMLESTYLIIVSDHGHIGGRESHLERFDLVNEFFHQPAEVDVSGNRVGGGLGMTVKMDRYVNPTAGDHADDFVFVDAVGDGVARVSLPKGKYGSRDWSGPNSIQSLFRYPIRGLAGDVNLFEALKEIEVSAGSGSTTESPVDLVMAKIDDHRMLVTAANRGYAVIEYTRSKDGSPIYRYSVVQNIRADGNEGISWDVVKEPTVDPLLLAGKVACCLFNEWHDEEEWLRITMGSLYPDSVVTMARHMFWKPELAAREREYGVDLVITAKPGWQFNTRNEPGNAHGHPFQETMNFSLFMAGPNIRRGAVVTQPVRSVDVTPTILDMVGVNVSKMEFDGHPIRTVYSSGREEPHVSPMPLYWQDVDLMAWSPLAWEPRMEYPYQPKSVNQPMNFWDLSNLTYNVASIEEVSVNRIADDASRFVNTRLLQTRSREDRPLRSLYRDTRQKLDESPLDVPQLQLNKIALGDYSWSSIGNLSRARNVAGWAWTRTREFDQAVSEPFGGMSYLGTHLAGQGINAADYSANEVRRVGSRVASMVVDTWVLSKVEDSADTVINSGKAEPATRRVGVTVEGRSGK